MIELTKAEEQMMHLLWELGEGTVQDVIASIKEGKQPSRTTVSTIKKLCDDLDITVDEFFCESMFHDLEQEVK